jgi:hypothetical protein
VRWPTQPWLIALPALVALALLLALAVSLVLTVINGVGVMIESSGGSERSWTLVEACGGVAMSAGFITPPALTIGLAGKSGGIAGPVLAQFASSQFQSAPPYLLDVEVAADGSVSIRQTEELSDNPAVKVC